METCRTTKSEISRPLAEKTIHQMYWWALAIFCLGAFLKVTHSLNALKEMKLIDHSLQTFIISFRDSSLTNIAVDITALGSITLVTLITTLGVLILLLLKDKLGIIHLILASLGSGLWTRFIKTFISRERPVVYGQLVHVEGFSYPSGHAMMAASMFLTLGFLAARHFPSYSIRALLFSVSFLIVLMVGISRVYLGVHYPSDALSGILFGSAWAIILAASLHSKYKISSYTLGDNDDDE